MRLVVLRPGSVGEPWTNFFGEGVTLRRPARGSAAMEPLIWGSQATATAIFGVLFPGWNQILELSRCVHATAA